MATISIDYNSENKEVYLCGDIEAIKRNRFAWRYVRDYFSPREEMGRIVIPVMDEEPFPILSSIRSMLSKYGFTEKKRKVLKKFCLTFMKKNGNLMNFLKRLFVFEIMNAIKLSLRNLQILLLVISQQGRCILCSSFLRIIWRFLKMHVIFRFQGLEKLV